MKFKDNTLNTDDAGGNWWKWAWPHLSQGTLHGAQKLRLPQTAVAAVDVVELKPQALNFFKVKVQREDFGVGGVHAAAHYLGAIHLEGGAIVQLSLL